jgi:hypothetical protein
MLVICTAVFYCFVGYVNLVINTSDLVDIFRPLDVILGLE